MDRFRWDISLDGRTAGPPVRDPDSSMVAEMLGLGAAEAVGPESSAVETMYKNFRLSISPGRIIVVVGPSGAGKSLLLRAVARAVPDAIRIGMERGGCDDERLAIACLPVDNHVCRTTPAGGRASRAGLPDGSGPSLRDRLEILSRCGLAEAKALMTPAKFLSGGQLYRLALASAIWEAVRSGRRRLLLVDEFASALDAATGEVLAAGLAKLVRRYGLAVIVSTHRQELLRYLGPSRIIAKPLTGAASIIVPAAPGPETQEGSFPAVGNLSFIHHPCRCWPVEAGRIADYHDLGRFHYIAGRPAALKRVWVVRVPPAKRLLGGAETAAVLVVSPPVLNCRGRNIATAGRYSGRDRRPAVALLNAELECISRVVVHPTYRGCGLAVRLVRYALRHASAPLVEALAAMGAVHPFFELAGMTDYGRVEGAGRTYNYYLTPAPGVTMKTHLAGE